MVGWGGGVRKGGGGGHFVHNMHVGGFCFCKRHMGWGLYRNRAALRPVKTPPGSSAGQTASRPCRPDFRPKSSEAVSAGRHRRRASPPSHSDELTFFLAAQNVLGGLRSKCFHKKQNTSNSNL